MFIDLSVCYRASVYYPCDVIHSTVVILVSNSTKLICSPLRRISLALIPDIVAVFMISHLSYFATPLVQVMTSRTQAVLLF